MLHNVTYISLSESPEPEQAMPGILESSRRNNPAQGITGALLLVQDMFLQVLEGPKSTVEATMERIAKDARHSDMTVLLSSSVDQRSFADWSMGWAKIPDDHPEADRIAALGTQQGLISGMKARPTALITEIEEFFTLYQS
jgi:hypothetical protein